ncbi:hypothetical protein GCM10027053_44800 [Intrasporangium mesophilum]
MGSEDTQVNVPWTVPCRELSDHGADHRQHGVALFGQAEDSRSQEIDGDRKVIDVRNRLPARCRS